MLASEEDGDFFSLVKGKAGFFDAGEDSWGIAAAVDGCSGAEAVLAREVGAVEGFELVGGFEDGLRALGCATAVGDTGFERDRDDMEESVLGGGLRVFGGEKGLHEFVSFQV